MAEVNNFFRRTGKDDTIEPAYMRLMNTGSGGGGSTDITVADFNALKSRVGIVENRASTNSANISALQSRVGSLETSQTQQNNRLDDFDLSQAAQDVKIKNLEDGQKVQDERLDDIEEQLNSIGTTTTIINYISSTIGRDVPDSVSESPTALADWLKEQDDDGIDLDSLSKRIKEIEENIITIDDIESLVNG